MTKLMYDSTNPSAIPVDAPVVAGYADGRYQWSSADWNRFPNAIHVSIVCFPQSSGDILDIETGCASPTDVSGWLDRYSRPMFKVPTLYVNRTNWSAVRTAVGNRQVDYWVATLDGTQVVAGAAAVQYTDTGAYDISICQDWWPRVPPSLPKEIPMVIRNPADGAIYVVDASGKRHLGGLEYTAWKQTPGYAEIAVDAATVAEIPDVAAAPATNLQPVLDTIAALKVDLDSLTLKKV